MANSTANMSVTVTHRTARVPAPCDDEMMQRFIISVILELPVASIGILGNIVSFIVLCKHKHQLTTTKLLQGLAVVDSSVLLSVILLNSLRLLHVCVGGLDMYFNVYNYIFRWVYPVMHVFRQAQTWLIAVLTIDRWRAVCQPLKAQKLRSLSTAYKQMALILTLALIVTTPRFLDYQIDHSSPYGFSLTALSTNRMYTIIYKIIIFFLIMYLVPMVILIILNTQLLRTLRHAETHRNELQSWRSMQSNSRHDPAALKTRDSNHRSITVIVCVVVIICIASNMLAMTSHTLWSLAECFDSLSMLEKWRRHVARVSNVMVTLSSAVNFFIYCLCSQNFRTVLIQTFRCKNRHRRFNEEMRFRSRSQSSSTTFTNSSTRLSYRFINRTGNIAAEGMNGDNV